MTKAEAFDYLVELIEGQCVCGAVYEENKDKRLDYMAVSLVQIDMAAMVLKDAVKSGEEIQNAKTN